MIDELNHIIYTDHSSLAQFMSCKEKSRLASLGGWRQRARQPALDFGHGIHAAWEAYYDALAGGFHDDAGLWHAHAGDPLERAQAAFLRDMGHADATIPVTLESEERRSLERGLYLIEAYIYRWKREPYENILRPSGEPMTEVGFRYHIGSYIEYDLYHVGYIDRLMRNILTKRPVIVEGKTTTQALPQYIQQCKPNRQVTGYFPAAIALLGEPVIECLWDCMFISDRRPNLQKGLTDRWFAYGIDIDKDFARQITTRSQTDITEYFVELKQDAEDYCRWLLSGAPRWPRTAPGACHQYGGCQFRNRCSVNLDPEQEQQYMESLFKQERWEPWRKIVQRLNNQPK